MSLTIRVWSDYVCPYCFLVEKPLREVQQRVGGVEVEWMPFELRPEPALTLRPEDEYLPRVWRDSVYPMAERAGISIRLPSISPQPYTRTAFEGYQFAREHRKASAYHTKMMQAFFQRGENIGELDVLRRLAAELGLPSREFSVALERGLYTQKHREMLALAQRIGVRSVPTLLIGDQKVEGVIDADQLMKLLP